MNRCIRKNLIKDKWTIHITKSLWQKDYCFKSLCAAAMDSFSDAITLLTPPTCLQTDGYSMAREHSSHLCFEFLGETMSGGISH